MALLEVSGLSMSFADKQLYEDAEFQLNKHEHMGIVGQNGAGKSTLIKILTGQTLPVTGMINWQKNLKVGYLDQYAEVPADLTMYQFLQTAFKELFDKEAQINDLYAQYSESADEELLVKAGQLQEQLETANFYELDTKIDKVVTGLGLNSIGADHLTGQMSGGQRSKVILAKLLLENDDVIILDEPTNNLDTAHIEWLVEFLQGFDGSAIIISHDYEFLEQVTNTIADIAFGKITKYRGSFQQAMRQKAEKREQQLRNFEKQQAVIAKAEKFISKNKAGSKSKQARSREKMLEKMEVIEAPDEELHASFDFPYVPMQSQEVLQVKHLTVGYTHALLSPVSFAMTHGQKLLLKGFNGAGKSTLIKSILGLIEPLNGESNFAPAVKVNYFNQDLDWANDKMTPLEVMADAFPKLEPRMARQRLGAAGINAANAQKEMHLLSGGEQTKVKLAMMELVPSNFLIMDEPTNHLDEDTKQALKKALIRFEGNLILVSHEGEFFRDWLPWEIDVAALSLK